MNIEIDPRIETGADEWVKRLHEESRRKMVPGSYHISDCCGFGYDVTGGWCARQAWYKYKMGEDTEYNREKAGLFRRGHIYENMVAETILPDYGWKIRVSGPQNDTDERALKWAIKNNDGKVINVIGHIDLLASHKSEPDLEYVVEVKSTNFTSRDVFNKFCKEPDFPKPGNVLQVNSYGVKVVKPWVLGYISIGDISMRGWRSLPNPDLLKTVESRVLDLDNYLTTDTVPDGHTNWMCLFGSRNKPRTYCDAYNWCRRMGNYGPHPQFYGYCVKEKLKTPEFDFTTGTTDLMVEPDTGRLMCPSCGARCQRRMLTPKDRAEFGKVILPEHEMTVCLNHDQGQSMSNT